jgi:hypothetical protein
MSTSQRTAEARGGVGKSPQRLRELRSDRASRFAEEPRGLHVDAVGKGGSAAPNRPRPESDVASANRRARKGEHAKDSMSVVEASILHRIGPRKILAYI